jgi:microcystin-dependent protein
MPQPYVGQIIMTGFGFTPRHFAPCNGQRLSIQQYPELFQAIGTLYGGDGVRDFAVPNLQGATPVGSGPSADPDWKPAPYALNDNGGAETVPLRCHRIAGAQASQATAASLPAAVQVGSFSHSNMQPFRVLNFCIALRAVGTPMIGEIRMLAFASAPRGWLPCDGSVYQIDHYDELFMVLGATHGGDGAATFAVPDLRGQVPVHQGLGGSHGARRRVVGDDGGHEASALQRHDPSAHGHACTVSASKAESTGALLAAAGAPQDNLMPTLTATFCIAARGAFPSRAA